MLLVCESPTWLMLSRSEGRLKRQVHPVAFTQGRNSPRHSAARQNALITQFCLGILAGTRLPDRIPCQESSSARPDGESLAGQRLRVNSFTATYSFKTRLQRLSTEPCKMRSIPKGARRSGIPQTNAKAVAF